MEDLDTDTFITLIKSKTSIWNHKSSEYGDKIQRNQDWASVCEAIIPDFAEKSNKEKNAIATELQSKWKVLRDGFMRSIRNQNKKSGTATKLYKYHDQMLFLKILSDGKGKRRSSGVGTFKNQCEIPPVEIFIKKQKLDTKETSSDDTLIETLTKNVIRKLNNDKNDEDKQFLLCLLSDIKRIPDDYKLDAKSDIINVIRHYTNKTANQYQAGGSQSSHADYFRGTDPLYTRTMATSSTQQDSPDDKFNVTETTHRNRTYRQQSFRQSNSSPDTSPESKIADIFPST